MTHRLTVALSPDEALVLLHMLDRFQRTDRLRLAHNAEFVALGRVHAQLDVALVEPFMSNYGELLLAARRRIAEGFEGLAPGVDPEAEDLPDS